MSQLFAATSFEVVANETDTFCSAISVSAALVVTACFACGVTANLKKLHVKNLQHVEILSKSCHFLTGDRIISNFVVQTFLEPGNVRTGSKTWFPLWKHFFEVFSGSMHFSKAFLWGSRVAVKWQSGLWAVTLTKNFCWNAYSLKTFQKSVFRGLTFLKLAFPILKTICNTKIRNNLSSKVVCRDLPLQTFLVLPI